MKSIRWVSLCASNKVIKTMMHFFPRALNTNTPYPVTCKLGLFGEGQNADSVVLDGVRLNQASGILLDAAFPALNGDYAGFIGVTVDISLRQQSVILDQSSLIMELMSFSSSTMFYPTRIVDNESKSSFFKSFPVLSDTLTQTSLVVVNSTLAEFNVNLLDVENNLVVENLRSLPLTAKEYSIDKIEDLKNSASVLNSCWTNGSLSLLRFDREIPLGVCVYILCRDRANKRITACFNL